MKYVLFYESAEDVAETAPVHFAAHQARWHEFRERGSLLLIGPFTDRTGAMAVFTTRAAAEEFVAGDPFVLNGVIRNWYIREWLEAIATP
jgi:uncharacterized protein YciI